MSEFKQSSHIRLVSDLPDDAVRWVRIADRTFAFTPTTCFRGITSNGQDYYPYYDDSLHTVDGPDNDDFYDFRDNYYDLRGYRK